MALWWWRMRPTSALARTCLFGPLAVALAACGGKTAPEPAGPQACRITTSFSADKPLSDRTVPPPFWFSLLLRYYHPSGSVARPVRDCEGQLVEWTVGAGACGAEPAVPALEPRPLSERDLVTVHLGEGRRLVWVITDRFANGEGLGPVAIARFDTKGVVVETLGVLRAHAIRPELRLETLSGGQVLVAEGEACEDEADPRTCTRGVRVVAVGQRRFMPRPLADEKGQCLGRAFFPLRAEGTRGEGRQRKRYQMQSTVRFEAGALTVQEQLTIQDIAETAGSADAAQSAVARLRADRRVVLENGDLVTDRPSLLERWASEEAR